MTKPPPPTLLSLNDKLTQLSESLKRSRNGIDDSPRPYKRRRNMAELASLVLGPPTRKLPVGDNGRKDACSRQDDCFNQLSKDHTNDSSASLDVARPLPQRQEMGSSMPKPENGKLALQQSTLAFLQVAQQQYERVCEEIREIEVKRQNCIKQQAELWGVYKYGLTVIVKVTDLRDAPDAIMPGNF
jgi:hypothetical protein